MRRFMTPLVVALAVAAAVAGYVLLKPCGEELPVLVHDAEYPTLQSIQVKYGAPMEVVTIDTARLMMVDRETRGDAVKGTRLTINIWRDKCRRGRRLVAIVDQATGAVLLVEAQSTVD